MLFTLFNNYLNNKLSILLIDSRYSLILMFLSFCLFIDILAVEDYIYYSLDYIGYLDVDTDCLNAVGSSCCYSSDCSLDYSLGY